MRLLEFFGGAMVLTGACMLTVPFLGPVWRWLARAGLGVKLNPHPASRVAAWGLVLLGLAVVYLARIVA